MKYQGAQDFNHGQQQRIGVLISNLGTPPAPTRQALRAYLKQFLSDPRVVEVPRLLWWLILNLIILNVRPARSARAYRAIWTEQGSPLMQTTRLQAKGLQQELDNRHEQAVTVAFAMRYGEPSISQALQSLFDQGARRLLVLPLYPQYSGATTASTFDALGKDFKTRRWLPDLRFISHYHDYQPYIDALAGKLNNHWQTHGRADKLLFSYHGEPLRYLEQGDPYYCECHKTSRLLAETLGLSADDYLTTFQSRFGKEPWLQPYTDETLQQLAQEGADSVQVMCPGFSSDCLETLEEIAVENRQKFLAAGGKRFEYIPCLNDDQSHIQMLADLIDTHLQAWPSGDNEGCKERAIAVGAKN